MIKLFKPQALYTFTLVSASIASAMFLIQACGGGGDGFGSAFAAAGAGAGAGAGGNPASAPDPIVGVWESTATGKDCNTGAVLASFKGMSMFNSGGTASFESSRPPAGASSGQGTWQRDSGGSYTFTLMAMRFNPDGTFAGTQKSKGTRTLSADGNSFTSTVAGQIIDPAGNVVSSTCVTDTGSRVSW